MKKLFVALMVLVGLISFTGCKSFKVNVNLENSNGKTVYLNRYENETMKTLDSVVVADNMAVFKVRASKNLDALHIMMDGWRRPLAFFADNQDVNITGDCQKYNTIKVEGSESHKAMGRCFGNRVGLGCCGVCFPHPEQKAQPTAENRERGRGQVVGNRAPRP